MLLSINFQQAQDFIQSPRLIRRDRVVPAEFPECVNSTYRPGYDWLYQYERDIAGFLSPWLKPYRYDLIGEKGILCEALSNAFSHGHGKDPRKIITVEVYRGERGLLVRVEDSGKGFNVDRVYQSYLKKKVYYHTAGNGIHLMASSRRFGIFYSAVGATFHLLYAFDKDLALLNKNDSRACA
ncbi:MAG: ATP-binding protein [Desulfobacteraceae bacterium]|jgi:hypothetical protein